MVKFDGSRLSQGHKYTLYVSPGGLSKDFERQSKSAECCESKEQLTMPGPES